MFRNLFAFLNILFFPFYGTDRSAYSVCKVGKEDDGMAKSTDGKLKILYVKDILEQAQQNGRTISMREILCELHAHGMPAERKSVSDDLRLLKQYGLPIVCLQRGRATVYSLKKSP